MGPWEIAGLGVLGFALLVLGVWRFVHHPGTRAAPVRALDATPDGWGSMTLAEDRHAATIALWAGEVAHEDPFDGLPEWAHPSYPRITTYGWEAGPGTAGRGGGWDDHEWDPWHPADPTAWIAPALEGIAGRYGLAETRLADTGDMTSARQAAIDAECHRLTADCQVWLALRAGQWRELAASR